MDDVTLPLLPRGPRVLELRWEGGHLHAGHAGTSLSEPLAADSLEKGCELVLPDGSGLSIRLRTHLTKWLEVRHGGELIPATRIELHGWVRGAALVLGFHAVARFVLGAAALLAAQRGLGVGMLGFGGLFAITAISAQSTRGDYVAQSLLFGLVIYALEGLLALVGLWLEAPPLFAGMISLGVVAERGAFGFLLARGWKVASDEGLRPELFESG